LPLAVQNSNMTDKTTYRNKARAVFLAFIMVTSVFAGTAVFAGSAVADVTEAGDPTDVPTDDNVGQNITNINVDSNTTNVTIDVTDLNDSVDLSSASVDASDGAANFNGDYTEVTIDNSSGENLTDLSWVQITNIDASEASDEEDLTYTVTQGDSVETSSFDIVKSTDLQETSLLYEGQVGYDTNYSAGEEVQLRSGQPDDDNSFEKELTADENQTVYVDTSGLDSNDYYLEAEDGSISTEFEVAEQSFDVQIDGEDDEVSVGNDGTSAEDVDFTVESNRGGNFNVEVSSDEVDDEDLVKIFDDSYSVEDIDSDAEDGVLVSDVGAGDEESLNFSGIDASESTFDFDVEDTSASDSIDVTIEDTGDGELNVESATEERGDVAEITVSADNADSGTLVIGEEDEVGYQANVSIDDFGDNDEITVYFDTYAAGNDSIAGASDDYENLLWTETDGASIEDIEQNELDQILAAGYDYEMTAKAVSPSTYDDTEYSSAAEETLDAPDNVGSLFIEERSTNAITTWTASDDGNDVISDVTDEDIEDRPGAVADAIDDGLVTETDNVAYDDSAIFQIEASGLAGLMANTTDAQNYEYNISELAQEDNFYGDDSRLKFEISEVASNPNDDDTTVTLESEDITLVHDKYGESDEYFVVVDTAGIDELDDEEDNELTLDFAVQDDRLLRHDTDEDSQDDLEDLYEEIETDFNVDERTASLDLNDDDVIEVEQGEDEITGETNIAPGSEVTIRLRGTEDYRFSESQSEIQVNTDGTFAGEFDFSDREVDTTFEATLRGTDVPGDDPEEDGIVVETVDDDEDDDSEEEEPPQNETDTGNDTDTGGEDGDTGGEDGDTDDEDGETGGDDEDGESEEETPGFGAIVALVAVLGAALLATRRQN